MKDAATRSPSPVPSNTNPSSENPLSTFFKNHPHAAVSIAKGAGIGAALGIGVGLGLPGRGAGFRTEVILLISLGFALIGGLIAAARAIPRKEPEETLKEREWLTKVEARMKSGSSNPVPRRIAPSEDKET